MTERTDFRHFEMGGQSLPMEREVRARIHPEQIALIGALLALALLIVLGVSDFRKLSHASVVLDQARAASASTERLLVTLLDAETGQRGFLLTSSPAFLHPYQDAVKKFEPTLSEFREATGALPLDEANCKKIESLGQGKMAELEATLRMAKSGSRSQVLEAVDTVEGNRLMAQIRALGTHIEAVYAGYAAQQQLRVADRQLAATAVTGVGCGLVAVILIWAVNRLGDTQAEQTQLLLKISNREKQYRQLADRLQSVREEERAHLAREIHDVLGQAFTGIKLDIAAASRRLDLDDKQAASEKLKIGIQSVDESIRLLRRIASELRPPLLDHIGLVAAVKAYADEYTARTGIVCRVTGDDARLPLSADERIAIYRIYQESLTNIARHSGVKEAFVHVAASSNSVSLRVEDKGVGFDTKKYETSLGLLGMRERARSIGATFTIHGGPGQGTVVELVLPRSL
jgi:signal transduction histidine kinase